MLIVSAKVLQFFKWKYFKWFREDFLKDMTAYVLRAFLILSIGIKGYKRKLKRKRKK